MKATFWIELCSILETELSISMLTIGLISTYFEYIYLP